MNQYFLINPKIPPKITDTYQSKCEQSRFIKPIRFHYKQDGKEKKWDIIHSHDSVSILIYEQDLRAFVIVKQFRPAVFMRNKNGYIYELCAGLVDKPKKTLEQIATEEIFEECGYKITPNRLEKIGTFYTSVGISGSKQTIFFAKVNKNDKYTIGGGIDDEDIEVLYLKENKALTFSNDEQYDKTAGLSFAINYFFYQKKDR